LKVECRLLNLVSCFLLFTPVALHAQTPPHLPPGGLVQLQVAQPAVDVSSPVTATAEFDPLVVRPGGKTFYRVNIRAAETSIRWPAKIPVPSGLKFGADARGQLTEFLGNKFLPLTAFVYEVRPAAAGHFTVTNFTVNISGRTVEIPAASLEVVVTNPATMEAGAPMELALKISATNLFLGQPFHARVMLPAGPGNRIEALREIQLDGDGLMSDKTAMRRSIEVVNINGRLMPAFICEMTVTPIAAGTLKFSAQGFTAGREFSGPITIHGQVTLPGGPPKYDLLVSEPVEIHVRPLPATGETPAFTGAIGKFFRDPPRLSTNRIQVGEPVSLKVVFHGEGDLTRFVPPVPPLSRDWQIIANPPPATGFTLIPLTDETHETPAIPFSYFDPETAKYEDLTIPPLPVTVTGEGLPVQAPAFDGDGRSAAPQKLSGLALTPGKSVASLKPLQLRGWFFGVQLLPVFGLLALWQWDRRRRFLEAHPEIVRRRQARRALRREKRKLQKALESGDAKAFVQHAADAMKIAVAPHYPANPQALVCADVLDQLDETGRNGRAGEIARIVFTAADTQFAAAPQTCDDLLGLDSEVEVLLQKLEAKL
jgi:hypothetical protein